MAGGPDFVLPGSPQAKKLGPSTGPDIVGALGGALGSLKNGLSGVGDLIGGATGALGAINPIGAGLSALGGLAGGPAGGGGPSNAAADSGDKVQTINFAPRNQFLNPQTLAVVGVVALAGYLVYRARK